MKLLDDHLGVPQSGLSPSGVPQSLPTTGHRNRGFTILLIVGLVLAIVALVALSIALLHWLFQLFSAR
jgi:hypothetical protein